MIDAPTTRTRKFDYRGLYKKLERTLRAIERSADLDETLSAILEGIVTEFREDLGFVGGRLYRVLPDVIVLQMRCGKSGSVRPGLRIPRTYRPIQTVLEQGYVFMAADHPDFDPAVERDLEVQVFAAIAVGAEDPHIVSFTVEGPLEEERILFSLNTIRHVINLKLEHQELVDQILQARDIQMSLLPSAPPRFWAYDVAGRSIPAEAVGGDLFDYIPISDRILGIAIADSSGHGLPAALQARDVIIGLRMGLEEDLKIIRTVEKLNRVIHNSNLATKFISLFYAELERNGNFTYCNAGHPPALLHQDGRFQALELGGMVLGPAPAAKYERGFVSLRPGDLVVLYTDGITEAGGPRGEEFGVARLEEETRRLAARPAAEIVEGILAAAESFCGPEGPEDDRTVVVVKHPALTAPPGGSGP
ncbi:MAG: PP2C family protein-serine/threonine phosphatase [Acidobacteria bacterium]|nr:PP2C family protein-serine/threonine phosphatase [Acidobacteriota bacterium]